MFFDQIEELCMHAAIRRNEIFELYRSATEDERVPYFIGHRAAAFDGQHRGSSHVPLLLARDADGNAIQLAAAEPQKCHARVEPARERDRQALHLGNMTNAKPMLTDLFRGRYMHCLAVRLCSPARGCDR